MADRKVADFVYKSSMVDTTMVYKELFTKADNVIDIGAFNGKDLKILTSRIGGNAIAIEANPDMIPKLKERLKGQTIILGAATNYTGITPFMQVESEYDDVVGMSSIQSFRLMEDKDAYSRYAMETATINEIFVPAVKMYSILDSLCLDTVDLVKIDVGSHSWSVLEGFGQRLWDVKMFHVETEIQTLNEINHRTSRQIASFMNKNEFKLVRVYTEWGTDTQDHLYVNTRFSNADQYPDLYETVMTNNIIENRNF